MPQPEAHQFGITVHALRTERGLTLRQLGAKTRFHPSYISRLERGQIQKVTPEALRLLANALEVDVEELYEVAYLPTAKKLPELAPYLRAKYDLPERAIEQVDEYVQALRDRWQNKDQTNGKGKEDGGAVA